MAALLTGRFTGRPFDDGVTAFDQGLARTRSPYPAGTRDHAEWLRGWDLAQQREDEEELAEALVVATAEALGQLSP